MVLTVYLRVLASKNWPKVGQNAKIRGPYIFYMAPLNKMLDNLLYQLFMTNKKAFLQFIL